VVYLFRPGVIDGGLDIVERRTTTAGGDVSYETAPTPPRLSSDRKTLGQTWGCDRTKSLVLMRMSGYNKIDTGIGKNAKDLRRAPV